MKPAQLAHHPKRVLGTIRELARNLDRVRMSQNINELAAARTVSMRAIWTCLETGSLVPDQVHPGPDGVHAKLESFFQGDRVTVDLFISNEEDGSRMLEVLYASREE